MRLLPAALVLLLGGGISVAPLTKAAAKPSSKITRPKAVPVSPERKGHCENPQWSRDGRALAYERVFLQDRKIELDVLTPAIAGKTAAKERRVEIPPLEGADAAAARAAARYRKPDAQPPLTHGAVCREFSWGPESDPDIFAHSCNVMGQTFQLFWSEGAQLTDGAGAAGQPALSPKGWRLAYVSGVKGAEGLKLIDDLVEGTAAKNLAREVGRVDRMPVWSPSGRAIAFVGHDARSADIYVVREVGGPKQRVVRLTDGADDEVNPSWSPDGRRLAYFARRSRAGGRRSRYDLFIVDAQGSKPFRVAKDVVLTEKHGPAWTPSGSHLVFVKNFQRGKLVDPLRAVAARPDAPEIKLRTGTVSNQDPAVAKVDGRWWVAFTSLGYWGAQKLAWRRVFVFPLDQLGSSGPQRD